MNRRLLVALVFICTLTLLGLGILPTRTLAAGLSQEPSPTQPPQSAEIAAIVQAVTDAVENHQEIAALAINQISVSRVDVSTDGSQALVYLDAADPQTGQSVAREPGLAVAQLKPTAQKTLAAGWQITFQADAGWQTQFDQLSTDLKPQEYQLSELAAPYAAQSTQAITLGGYLLPWAAGQAKTLTWSVSHASCSGEDCRYAFDWADGTHFPILAAKAGTVFAAVWNWPNDDHTSGHTNYLVLQDTSTSPTSYQIYYHMEQNSVPAELRIKGAPVAQGQYVGNADNTGASSGSHLHFMVHVNPYGLWGQSVDITFRDVTTNWDSATQGGRPRMCSETVSLPQYGTQCQPGDKYISGNHTPNPPDGGLSAPVEGTVLTTGSVHVEGWGQDDQGVTKMQVIAKTTGDWVDVGSPQTPAPLTKNVNFAEDVDLCAAGINLPDGPVTLALRLWDVEGSQVIGSQGIHTIFKQAGCPAAPPPPCNPGIGQVAVYSQPNYAGSCQLFPTGDYLDASTFGSLGDNQAAAVLVGANASVTLFQDAGEQGRAETLIASDPNLADNVIGSGTVSSLRVQTLGANTQPPSISVPQGLTSDDALLVSWRDAGGAYQFMPDLYDSSGHQVAARIFDHTYFWSMDSLPAGSYQLKICVSGTVVANPNSVYQCPAGWTTATTSFSVAQASLPSAAPAAFPYSASFDQDGAGWTAGGSGWALGPGANGSQGYVFNQNGACQDGTRCRGWLTSPPIQLPASGAAYLRFKYQYSDPELNPYADLRRVQVSTRNGDGTYAPFKDLLALGGKIQDTPGVWLDSPDGVKINASGQVVRIRFLIDTLDGVLNSGLSWSVDQVSLTATAPAAADVGETNQLTTSASGAINPIGDVDLYSFSATQGKDYQVDLLAQNFTPSLELLDSDQSSVIAVGHTAGSGMRVSFQAPASGVYYLRVRSNPFPQGAAGDTYTITLTLLTDTTPPSAALSVPTVDGILKRVPAALTVSATDNASGISHVDYYYQAMTGTDWRWSLVGAGWDSGDGWAATIDPDQLPDSGKINLWARVSDWAGNVRDVIAFEVPVAPKPIRFLPMVGN